MKKKKLKLNELNVKSFTTSIDKIRGGLGQNCSEDVCHLTLECPTQQCDSHLECATILVPGQVGLCEAPKSDKGPC
ncbi:MAG: pinensin family lanthipeptide [Bacteroidota bacterium]